MCYWMGGKVDGYNHFILTYPYTTEALKEIAQILLQKSIPLGLTGIMNLEKEPLQSWS